MHEAVLIPARFRSTRFPGKALANLRGASGDSKSLIHRSWEAACAFISAKRVFVVTDDERIATEAQGFGAQAIMTSANCENGTERCNQALAQLPDEIEVIFNLQGDSPLTPPHFLHKLSQAMRSDSSCSVATVAVRCDEVTEQRLRADRAEGRVGGTTVVFAANGDALYFSKECLPFAKRVGEAAIFHHIGLYAYRRSVLADYLRWGISGLEQAEGLEQLRFLENGVSVRVVQVDAKGRFLWELNNPEDTPLIEEELTRLGIE